VRWALVLAEPTAVVHDAVVAALTSALAEMTMDAVLGEGRRRLSVTALARAQARLDLDGRWVTLQALDLTDLRPPAAVQRAFAEVQSAFVEQKTQVDAARSARAEAQPRATAEAERTVRQAEADAALRLATARGDAERFLALRAAYRQSPAVVHRRLYQEALEQSFAWLGSRVLVPPHAEAWRLLIPGDGSGAGRTWTRQEGH
jgi:membrane protease subunit HflK